ncbi:hypothetical protein VC83_05832 [Pseudogymnoascus destructans]|uniref:DNA polymerase n=2 Tax=Pseudogymnoascus destructans TaxID=655981 RepID=L8G8G3_PSED2|nr:uncharacterized protein VC83_05832 [Pseudogymnoascus destructans]ELR08933.1 hypothetical protein GMDG_03600 [Pseudogymnoascus destructans 20631-21]OAF57098.1 hypothetical protein VC83_05832 [Pseudogymnoascus destructans]
MPLDLPITYLLSAHIPEDKRLQLEDEIPNLTYDITEAKLVLGKVATKKRAEFELRSRKLWTEEVKGTKREEKNLVEDQGSARRSQEEGPARKKRRTGPIKIPDHVEVVVLDSSTESEAEEDESQKRSARERSGNSTQSEDVQSPAQSPRQEITSSPPREKSPHTPRTPTASPEGPVFNGNGTIKVVKLSWFEESVAAGHMLPLDGYIVYEGRRVEAPKHRNVMKPPKSSLPGEIIARAHSDSPDASSPPFPRRSNLQQSPSSQAFVTRPTPLIRQTTSEHDNPPELPPIPDYLKTSYSCQRTTPLYTLNDPFIEFLVRIRQSRILTDDEVGVRAYSTSIASLAAYPHTISTAEEILHLPGCSERIAALWQEFNDTGHIGAVDDIDKDPEMQTLNLFYEIWGVGPKGARDFYYRKGWRDLDDVVEFGWNNLSRVQQIGVKYYEELQQKIPRDEVERIGAVILEAANHVAPGCQMTIVGGYRRGKPESGDVDVVVSNPDEIVTLYLVQRIVEEIERREWITHTLLLSTANSERKQTAVSWKGDMGHTGGFGVGFDTLDKALVVWQDPEWPTREEDLAADPRAKNPNVHRRVDIIVSPWRTVGCAVAGWTSGTTFQRDLRRYVKAVLGLKFDSSGVRRRDDGAWVDLEGVGGKAPDMLTAEKRVFEGLGLEWREPGERCTR